MSTYGLLQTAQNNMTRPYGGVSPFAPAGITDATRQGWATGLQGQAMQMPIAQQYAQQMGGMNSATQNFVNQGLSGGFGQNPWMQGAAGSMANTAGGGGFNPYTANRINQVGASFNPMNRHMGNMITGANQRLARDFQEGTMQDLNRNLGASGPGAYGGTRAGVAQGIREQGLADAMQKQTTDMTAQMYESGLNRYVQDRGNTLNAAGNAGQLANQSAANLGNLGLGSLQQMNQMGQWGMGTAMPNAIKNQFQAGMQPGQVAQGIGQTLGNIGDAQQTNNQARSDWLNQRYNKMMEYPDQRLQNANNVMSPYLKPGSAPQQQVAPQSNQYNSLLGGASAGYGAYDAWQKNQSSGNQAQNTQVPTGTQYQSSQGLYNTGLF